MASFPTTNRQQHQKNGTHSKHKLASKASSIERNKENVPFNKVLSKKDSEMEISPQHRQPHLKQQNEASRSNKEKPVLKERVNVVPYHKTQRSKSITESLWAKKGGLLKRGKPMMTEVFNVNNPEPLAVLDDDLLPMDIDDIDPLHKIREVQIKVPLEIQKIESRLSDQFNSPEYVHDIYEYLQQLERRFVYPDQFLKNSGEVTPQMRTILTDWFIQVQVHQELSQQTLHMTVELVDRFLTYQRIPLNMFQLVGISCMLIAAKYHERFAPEVKTLCYLTDNTYDKDQVLMMERRILKTIKFDLNIVDVTVFMDRILQIEEDSPSEMRRLTKYILDLTITCEDFVYMFPSLMASAAVCLSRRILLPHRQSWTLGLSYFSRYSEKDLVTCMKKMGSCLIKAPESKYQGGRVKYASETYGKISHHPALKTRLPDVMEELKLEDLEEKTI